MRRARLSLTPLEPREVPALFTVSLDTPGTGRKGDAGATYGGNLTLKSARVEAPDAVTAAASAVSGSLRVSLNYVKNKPSTSYQVSRATVSIDEAARKPWLATVDGDKVTLALEDLATMPGRTPDWDYNDRYLDLTVTEVLKVQVSQDATRVGEGGSVDFTATVTGGSGDYVYDWTFTNQETGAEETYNGDNARYTHTFQKAGKYSVFVEVTDDGGGKPVSLLQQPGGGGLKGKAAGKPVQVAEVLPLALGTTQPNSGFTYTGVNGNFAYGVKWIAGPENGGTTSEAKGAIMQHIQVTVTQPPGSAPLKVMLGGQLVDLHGMDYWELWGVQKGGRLIDSYAPRSEVHRFLKQRNRGFTGVPLHSEQMNLVHDVFSFFGNPAATPTGPVTITITGTAFYVAETTVHQLKEQFGFKQYSFQTGAGKLNSMNPQATRDDDTIRKFDDWQAEQREKKLISNVLTRTLTASWSAANGGRVTTNVTVANSN